MIYLHRYSASTAPEIAIVEDPRHADRYEARTALDHLQRLNRRT